MSYITKLKKIYQKPVKSNWHKWLWFAGIYALSVLLILAISGLLHALVFLLER